MMGTFRMANRISLALGLAALVACGGGGGGAGATPQPTKTTADTLVYTNPTGGTYQLVKNASKSTTSHLVLDLLGPAGEVSGVGLYLTTDPSKATWTTVDPGDGEMLRSATFSNPLIKSKVSGGTLQAGVYQKGATAAVSATPSTVLVSVAIDLKSNVLITNPPNILLTSGKALVLNAHTNPEPTTPITIATGILSAN